MFWNFNKSNTAQPIIDLSLLKEYLRITHTAEDGKLNNLIDFSVDYFSRQTGYLLQAGTLNLAFNFSDSTAYKHNRSRRDAFSYVQSGNYDFENFGRPTYAFGLAGNIVTQKPSTFSFFNTEKKLITLTESELSSLLPDNFIIVKSAVPLIIEMSQDISEFVNDKKYNPYSLYDFKMDLEILPANVGEDIKQCLIRLASSAYENPDTSPGLLKDSLITGPLMKYNCAVGI